MLRFQCPKKARSSLRKILELLNEQMPIGAPVATGLNVLCRANDHVFKVDPITQALLIGIEQGFEDFQKGLVPRCVLRVLSPDPATFDQRAGTLKVPKEGSERLRKSIDLAHLGQRVKDL